MKLLLPISFLIPFAPDGPVPTIPHLLAKLRAPREEITRYELVIDARTAQGNARAHIHHVWLDGPRVREDRLDNFAGKVSRRRVDCTHGPNLGEFFTVAYDPQPDFSKLAIIRPLTDRQKVNGEWRIRIEDLGATHEELVNLAARDLDWYVNRPEWAERKVVRARWKGMPAYTIVLSAPAMKTKPTLEVTLLPQRGYAAVSARHTWNREGEAVVETTESELMRAAGIWLPATCVYREEVNGKQTGGLTQKVQFVSLNKPIDAKAFTLEGMDLIPGTLVSTRNAGIRKWNGKQLVEAPEVQPPPARGK
ncbi:hypothetical protein FTUN_2894 [Frigoriglobus tundricola]|uniref:Uncharacterized protein n=2 Tax=Frigoriglobus tundricola TaxID=2774151 RepID=A0A6M5YPR9_9BACT|nr:hypothetical protein FTUN_2894 [Frigoriglobus tundricola]